MGLPHLIEIQPLSRSVRAEVTVPGSKSITNRALVLAALAQGRTVLKGALWSEDTQVMVECLRRLEIAVEVESDPAEPGNRTIRVAGKGGHLAAGGTDQAPLDLFVGNAGTAARFLLALVCLGKGVYRLGGVDRMRERPQGALIEALRELGYRIDSPNGKLPALVHGGGVRPGKCRVSIEKSSQFASALLLCAQAGSWNVEVEGENSEESSYVNMTRRLLSRFPKQGGDFQIEPDASSGSYFVAASHLMSGARAESRPLVTVAHWPQEGWQVDENFERVLKTSGLSAALEAEALRGGDAGQTIAAISRKRDLGDSIMMAVVLAALAQRPFRFTNLGRLRVQECERVVALRTELSRCGAAVIEEGDTLTVRPSELHGAEIETYNDHRMAMCFAVLGLKVAGIQIRNPGCVKKTFPNFFQKLASAAPAGLGTCIFEARTRRALAESELFAA